MFYRRAVVHSLRLHTPEMGNKHLADQKLMVTDHWRPCRFVVDSGDTGEKRVKHADDALPCQQR